MTVLPILCGILYIAFLIWFAVRRSYLIFLWGIFIIGFSHRMISVLYIDIYGPVYTEELFRMIGPSGSYLPMLVCYALTFLPFIAVFNRKRLQAIVLASSPINHVQVQFWVDRAFWAISAYIGLLYVDFMRIGIVPLFVGLERYEYTQQYGGFFHSRLMDWGNMLAFVLGLFYTIRLLRVGQGDRRFLYLLMTLFAYLFLAGHRFSAFYTFATYFLMPIGAAQIRSAMEGRRRRSAAEIWRSFSRATEGIVLIGLVAMLIGYALYTSYARTRVTLDADATERFLERVLVHQGELWYTTYERVFLGGAWDARDAFDKVFINPWVPDRSSSLPHLMVLEIGDPAFNILMAGSSYTGGYPEIVFELCGPVAGFIVLLIVNFLFAKLVLFLVTNILQGRYASAVFTFIPLYSVSIFYLSGMLNFFVQWVFWVKVLVGVIVWMTERGRQRQTLMNRSWERMIAASRT
jgi:hypothetical protein